MTIAPVAALLLINILYFLKPGSFIGWIDYGFAIFSLTIFPVLAYPLQRRFKILKGDNRQSERKLAVIFSIGGYIIGVIFALFYQAPVIEKIMYLTYLFSGLLIGLFTFVFKIHASGHMCGIAGPVALLIYVLGWTYSILLIILIAVIWSSLKLNRHTIKELLYGTIMPLLALFISVLIIL